MKAFISFEGPEGSGKSTQVAALAEHLRALGQDVLTTREPGGTAIGDQIRDILHNVDNRGMQPAAELLLLAASRAQIVAEVVRPALAQERLILCDRYVDSTLAYQGYGHGLDLDALRQITTFATGGLLPDLTVLLDIDSDAGLRRRRASGEWNRLDAYDLEFHRRVRQGYHALVASEPERWVVVDASQPADRVRDQIWAAIQERLVLRTPTDADF